MVALGLVGHGEHHESIGHVAVGDEALAAVEDVVAVLVLDSGGLLAGSVGTGRWARSGRKRRSCGRSAGRAGTSASVPRCRSR